MVIVFIADMVVELVHVSSRTTVRLTKAVELTLLLVSVALMKKVQLPTAKVIVPL